MQIKLRTSIKRNRGVALVAVIVLLSVSLTLFGLWARQLVREQVQLQALQSRAQAVSLAEAGLQRAIALRASNQKFSEDVWTVPADVLDKTHAARVRLRAISGPEPGRIRYEATAEFPEGAVRRVQITKSIETSLLPMKKS